MNWNRIIWKKKGKGQLEQPTLVASADKIDLSIYNENWFHQRIEDLVRNHPKNRMQAPHLKEEYIYEQPLIGFIRGDDPIFEEYKRIIGPFHLTPYEILSWQAEKNHVTPPKPNEISVVSYVLPLSQKTIDTNATETNWPSERWAQSRLYGELFSQVLSREIITDLMSHGILAVAPDSTPFFQMQKYPKIGWGSPWSHRHMAYAAGLGTFGLQDFLITEKGAAHRCGSFVVNLALYPNHERSSDIHANCLSYQGIPCDKCISRCPVHAITQNGHDKNICSKHVMKSAIYVRRHYKIPIYGCGLCSVGVPCSQINPMKNKKGQSI